MVECLGEAGRTDAIAGHGRAGHIGLQLVREAASAEVAVLSAIADVKATIPDARLVEAGPDCVGVTDAAAS